MGSFLARRLAATLPVLLIVAVLVFLMLRLTPGDPAAVLAGDAASTEQIARIRAGLGLDRSLPEQFAIWIGRTVTGDLGQSFYYKTAVTDLIGQLRKEGGYPIVVIEHDMHVVEGISDRVVALDHGVKIAEGSFGKVATDPRVVEAYLGTGGMARK